MAVAAVAALVALVALAAMSIGASYIPAPEVSLLMLIETIGGPIWVWAVIGEEPSFHTAVAGCILIVALASSKRRSAAFASIRSRT